MPQSAAQRAEPHHEETASTARRPVENIRHGNVEIAIWRNAGEKGPFYTASTPTIRYKEGDEWKDGSSFGRHDLLDMAEAAREAATAIRNLQKSKAQGQSR